MKFMPEELPMGLKYDLHLHSQFSDDSLIDVRKIETISKKKGLAGVAITDHSSLNGYQYLKRHSAEDFLVIPGMEVETEIGELIGLFITEPLNTDLVDFFDVIDDIKDKNGLVVIPHPFDKLRSNHLKVDVIREEVIRQYIDAVEIVNSRIINKRYIYEAVKFQRYFDLAKTGGSDAHTHWEIGNGFTFFESSDNDVIYSAEDLRKKIMNKESMSYGKKSNPIVHAFTVSTKWKNKLFYKK
ncbi:MAG: PHP domain-containing protein [Candidatus Lokiarchaeota archaeon]|nr:PHP domain-containing protein [Candidatus Lokiarchaeota archaeon]